jgi:hypothetical protein
MEWATLLIPSLTATCLWLDCLLFLVLAISYRALKDFQVPAALATLSLTSSALCLVELATLLILFLVVFLVLILCILTPSSLIRVLTLELVEMWGLVEQ